MITRVLLVATAVLAVNAQHHYLHGDATSSQSIIYHDASHNNHGNEVLVHTNPASHHFTSQTYYRPVVHFAPSSYHVATSTQVIAKPIIQDTPLHTAAITYTAVSEHPASIISHYTPLTHCDTSNIHQPSTDVHHAIPVDHHGTSLVHYATPVIHHATPYFAVPAVTLQHATVHYNQHDHSSQYDDYYTHPNYEFEYNVHDSHTGDIKSQHETRDGDTINGVYSLHEADGSIRAVQYNTNGNIEFNAVVSHSPSANVQPATLYYHN